MHKDKHLLQTTDNTKKIIGIEYIRAFAVISVFLHHVGVYFNLNIPYFKAHGGWLGVYLFFIISGYLITKNLEKDNVRIYYAKRILRVFPAYIFWFLFSLFINDKNAIAKISNETFSFLVNIMCLQHLSPKSLLAFNNLNVTWTLTIEVLWYVMAPIWIIYLRKNLVHIFIFLSILSVIWLKLSAMGITKQLLGADYCPNNYDFLFINNHFLVLIPYFLVGSLIYKFNLIRRIPDNHILTITLSLIIIFIPDKLLSFMNPSPIMPLLLGCFVILFFKIQKSNAIISFLSNISYSFYLTHFFVLVIVNKMTQINFYSKALFAMCVTIIISYLSYMFIERPCVRFIRKG